MHRNGNMYKTRVTLISGLVYKTRGGIQHPQCLSNTSRTVISTYASVDENICLMKLEFENKMLLTSSLGRVMQSVI